MRNSIKSAFATAEIAITVGITIVVTIAAISLFGQNVSKMVVKGASNNVLVNNVEKTSYSQVQREYSKSQIEVQITGAQGLEMLRKKANNKALEIIEANVSESNPDSNSIAYLAKTIEIITGEPHIGKFMTVNSNEHLNSQNSAYNVLNGSSTLGLIRKADNLEIDLKMNSDLAGHFNSSDIPLDSANYPTLSVDEKYQALVQISEAARKSGLVRKDCILINIQNNNAPKANSTKSAVANQLSAAIQKVLDNIEKTYTSGYVASTEEGKAIDRTTAIGQLTSADHVITDDDFETVKVWALQTMNKINTATSDTEAMKIFNNEVNNNKDILEIISKDTKNKAADNLANSVVSIVKNSPEAAAVLSVPNVESEKENALFSFCNTHIPESSAKLAKTIADAIDEHPWLAPIERVAECIMAPIAYVAGKLVDVPVIGPAVVAVADVMTNITTAAINVVSNVASGVKKAAKAIGNFFRGLFG